MKFLLRALVSILLLAAVLVGGLLAYLTFGEYRPDDVMPVQILQQQRSIADPNQELAITTFNIGYAALEKDADFFMDGGTMSRGLSKGRVEKNLESIIQLLQSLDSDFYLLQEVDVPSSRSYNINARDRIARGLPGFASSYGSTTAAWVPFHSLDPWARFCLESKLCPAFQCVKPPATGQRNVLACAPRSFEALHAGNPDSREQWRELVIAHIHLSAFDAGGRLRNEQLASLKITPGGK